MFEMTKASECHRDAVFVCGDDRFVVFDRSAETGDWSQACARLLSLWERLGEGAKLESQNRKPDRFLQSPQLSGTKLMKPNLQNIR